MSAALLKRSLSIVEDNVNDNKKKDKNNQQNDLQRSRKHIKNNQSKKFMPYNNSINKRKTTVSDIKNKIDNNANLVKENMEKLLKLSEIRNDKTNLDSKSVKKIFQRAQTKRYVLNVDSTKEEQTSIFTEEDFQNFEKEYFPTT